MKKSKVEFSKQINTKSASLLQKISVELEKHIQQHTARLVVGFSGGMDSTVLLYLIKQLLINYPKVKLLAVYVNHGLQQTASNWQQHCEVFCTKHSIPFHPLDSDLIQSSGEGLEKAARDARFTAFKTILKKNDLLCLGHHANDQSETIFYRLLRGTGVHGLAGIKVNNTIYGIETLRPLLNIEKNILKEFAIEKNLNWIEDPSNQKNNFDRNFLRNEVLPMIEKRWPDIHNRMSQSSTLFLEQSLLLDSLAESDSASLISSEGYLKIDKFRLILKMRAANFLSWWFRNILGVSLSRQRISVIYEELVGVRLDASFQQKCGEQFLIQSGNKVYLLPQNFFNQDLQSVNFDRQTLKIDQMSTLECEVKLSLYCFLKITAESIEQLENLFSRFYRLEFGVTNKTIRFSHKNHSTEIKKLFQQAKVPSWLKPHWPVLTKGNDIVSVLGFGFDKRYSTELKGMKVSCLFNWGQGRHLEVSNEIL